MTMAIKHPQLLSEQELQLFADELGVDSVGPKRSVLDRVIRYLKETNQYQPLEDKRKKRSKKKKRDLKVEDSSKSENDMEMEMDQQVEIEVVPEAPLFDPTMTEFKAVFNRFEELTQRKVETQEFQGEDEEEDMDQDEDEEFIDRDEIRKSKKKLRKMHQITVAQLKQIVKKPDVVEWIDVTSSDPLLLVSLKSTRNTAPVPNHWASKRKYLQGKRGLEKPPFELPGILVFTRLY